ncbi:ArnT family glycosyltransferase [Paludisphaera mucosa]|uniref:Glycosyltransferase RgtA/B/C/D-like domain-containing protein n=1 Tax=Paludisphaera mucosa TaxID=3030827 RepID=A0ABT6F9E0_9BACT|nr:DUF2142 domain-containing protein [Paludisphaera mucosa]MDG3004209.1 hypothetical protein [Paludisphaera mucosa]
MLHAHLGEPPVGSGGDASWAPFRRRIGALLATLVVARGLMLMCAMPPFEGWDEYQHVAYVQHLRDGGKTPVIGETRVPPAVLAQAVSFPQPGSAVRDGLSGVGAVGYQQFWADRQDGTAPAFRDAKVMLYQSQHGPLSYRMLQPVYAAFGGLGSVRSSVAGMRLMNLLLTAGAVAATFFCLSRHLAERRAAAWVGLALATYPLFLINGVRVANDALAVFLATLTIWLGLSLSAKPWATPGRLAWGCLAAGVLGGFAVLAKATNYALAPFLGFCVLAVAARPEVSFRRAAGCGLALAVGFLAVTQAEMRFNLAHYGSISSMQEAAVNHSRGMGRADLFRTALAIPWASWVAELWTRLVFFAGGWSFQGTHPKAVLYHRDLVAFGLLGWLWGAAAWVASRRRGERPAPVFANPRLPMACVVIAGGYTAALGYHMVQSKLAWGQWSTGAWYASAAMPWFLTLVVLGLMRWPLAGRLRALPPLALVATSVAAEALAVHGRMIPYYTGFASWSDGMNRLATLQPAWLGLPTMLAAAGVEVVALAALILVLRDDARAEQMPKAEAVPIGTRARRAGVQRVVERESRAAA